jgi:hypothetical protein
MVAPASLLIEYGLVEEDQVFMGRSFVIITLQAIIFDLQ